MKIKLALFLFIALLFVNCKDASKGVNSSQAVDATSDSAAWAQRELAQLSNSWVIDTLSYYDIVRVNDDPKKQGMSISVFMACPISSPKGTDLPAIQKTIAGIFDHENKPSTPKEAFDNIAEKYRKDAQNYARDWEVEGNEFINFSNFEQSVGLSIASIFSQLITVSTGYSSYLGGAHGSYYVRYDNIETKSGKHIPEEVLFKKDYESKLASMIRDEIARRNNLPNEEEHLSLLVELSEIQSSGNFYFDKTGIIFVYNQYEITPYVQGVVEISIPYSKIKPLINDTYLPLITSVEKDNA